MTAALIDASGVRRSCDTAASSAVRSSLASARPSAAAASARRRRRSTRERELAGERPQERKVLGRRARGRRRRASCRRRAARSRAPSSGRVGTGSPADALDDPPVAARAQDAPRDEQPNVVAQPGHERGQRILLADAACRSSRPASRPRPGACAASAASARRRGSRAARRPRRRRRTRRARRGSRRRRSCSVWNGGVKNQFARRNAATAVTTAGTKPPIAATATTTSR